MLRLLAVLALTLALARPALADPSPSAPAPAAPTAAPAPSPTIVQLGAEYRRLRAVRGHMSGPGGSWNDDVDRFGGRKHVVMQQLGDRLAHATRAGVLRAMGRPDAVARPGDMLWQLAAPRATDGVLLVYYWRGAHDFLYFVARGNRVVGSDWWMAYE